MWGIVCGSQLGDEFGCQLAEVVEIGRVRGAVEACVFYRCTEESCAGLWPLGARDDVDVLAAVDFVECEASGELNAEHLAFDGVGVRLRPSADGGDELGRRELAGCGLHVKVFVAGLDFGVFAEVDGGCADGSEESGSELARVEGVLGEAEGGAVGEVLDGGVGLIGDGEAGEGLDALQEGGIERDAEAREREKRGRVVGIFGGEHAGGCGGGLRKGGVAFEDRDAGTAGVELKGERQTDDAGSGDKDVWISCRNRTSQTFHDPLFC